MQVNRGRWWCAERRSYSTQSAAARKGARAIRTVPAALKPRRTVRVALSSLAPGPGLSHGAVWASAREGTVREAGGEKQSEPGKVFEGRLRLLRGGLAILL